MFTQSVIKVDNKKDLKHAVTLGIEKIEVTGKLAMLLKPLASRTRKKIDLRISEGNSLITNATALSAAFSALAIPVAITLIITVGIVTIVAILKDYNIHYENGKVILSSKRTKSTVN